jgi:biotin carboxyl carrier protein
MAEASANQLLAQLLQITIDVAKQDSPAAASQLLAAKLAQLFRADRVLLFATASAKPKLKASDSHAAVPPTSAYSDDLSALAQQLKQQAEGKRVSLAESCWLPLDGRQALLLQRPLGQLWQTAELNLLEQVAPALAASIRPPQPRRLAAKWLAIGIAALLLLPVPDKVVAPAIVESNAADRMYAPLDGVVESLLLSPGAKVQAGDVLLRYQQRDWQQQRRQALREQELAEAELERLRAASWQDSQARAAVPAQQLRIEQAKQQLQYLEMQLAETEVRATQSGILLIDDPQALVGSLVQAGELLFTVADPQQLRLKLHVPVADFGKLAPGRALAFRADATPFTRWSAELSRLGADVQLSEQQQPSIIAMADFADNADSLSLRLGERGTARVDAGWTLLGITIFRKPWQTLRAVLPL